MNIFLDCGFYKGNALQWYIEQGIVDKDWVVYGFEARPRFKCEIDRFPMKVNLVRKAVWVKDDKVPFWISAGREDASHVEAMTWGIAKRKVMVPAIDFSKFVYKLPIAHIICSMDIEGSEYPVLKKMFRDDTIARFSVLDIEFHHRMMPDKTEKDSQKLIDKLEAKGVQVKLKVPLN